MSWLQKIEKLLNNQNNIKYLKYLDRYKYMADEMVLKPLQAVTESK